MVRCRVERGAQSGNRRNNRKDQNMSFDHHFFFPHSLEAMYGKPVVPKISPCLQMSIEAELKIYSGKCMLLC